MESVHPNDTDSSFQVESNGKNINDNQKGKNSIKTNNEEITNSWQTTKTIDLLNAYSYFFNEIQKIIIPNNSLKINLLEDKFKEEELTEIFNNIISEAKKLKNQVNSLNEKIKEMEATKEFVNSTSKDIKEAIIKEISIVHKKNLEEIEKKNSEILSNIIEKSLKNVILSLKELIKKNSNNPQLETKAASSSEPKFFKTGINFNKKINFNTFKNLRTNNDIWFPNVNNNQNSDNNNQLRSHEKYVVKKNKKNNYSNRISPNIITVPTNNHKKFTNANQSISKSKSKSKNGKEKQYESNNKSRKLNKYTKYKLNINKK